MDKILNWAGRYHAAITVVAALFIFAAVASVDAAEPPAIPDGMNFISVPFQLACAKPARMNEILLKDHQEIPMVAGTFNNGTTWLWFVNEANTTASFVFLKSSEMACIIFSGSSDSDTALVPNMQPKWPLKEVSEKEWNI